MFCGYPDHFASKTVKFGTSAKYTVSQAEKTSEEEVMLHLPYVMVICSMPEAGETAQSHGSVVGGAEGGMRDKGV